MASPVRVVFNADTGQYVEQVNNATGAVTRQGQAVKELKDKELAWTQERIRAAKEAGASSNELAKIIVQNALRSAAITEENVNKENAALDRRIEKQKALEAELKRFSANGISSQVPESHGDDITNKQRASALLRGGGIRAGESFLTQFDAFNKLSAVAFPVLGLTSIATEAFHAAEAFKAMYDSAEKLPEVLKDGFEAMNQPLMSGVDNLRKVNDELEITNAHLAHKPANTMALAIDELRIKADQAAESARKAYLDFKKLFAENQSGVLQKMLFDKGETGGISGDIERQMKNISDLERANQQAVRSGNDTPEAQAQRDKAKKAALDGLRQYVAEQRKIINGTVDDVTSDEGGNVSTTKVKYSQKFGNQDANKNILDGTEDFLNNTQDEDAERKRNAADTVENKRLQDQAKQKEQATAAQRAAQEAARKAMEAQRKQWETEDDSRKLAGDDSPLAETNTWAARVMGLKAGSEQYIYAKHQLAEKLKALTVADAEAGKQAAEKWQKDQRASWDLQHSSWESETHRTAADEADYWSIRVLEADKGSENYRLAWDKYTHALVEMDRQAEEARKARSKATLEQGQQAAAYAEATLAIQVQTGQISRQDAAYQQANIHAEQYRQKMEELRKDLAAQTETGSAGYINAQAAIDKAEADRKIQIMQDAANEAASSWQGALKNANAVWVQDAQDSAKQVSELYGQAMNGLNENLSDLAVGDKSNFAGMFKGLGKTVVGDGLKHIEAPILSKLGLGKADGSASNPFSVKIVGGQTGGGSFSDGLAGSLSGLFGKSDSGGAGGVMSTFASFASSALSFIPGGSFLSGLFGGHRALGGGVKAGVTYDVGEMGREEFTPDTDGTITPNNKLSSGTATYQIFMDGGVTPEQVHQQITSALKAVHPKVVRDSANAVSERMARRPRSANT